MSNRSLVAAGAVSGLSLLCVLAWLILLSGRLGFGDATWDSLARIPVVLALTGAGLLIIAHRRAQVVGWLLLLTAFAQILSRLALAAGDALNAPIVGLTWAAGSVMHVFTLLALPLWAPDGTLPTAGRRIYAGALALWSVLVAVIPMGAAGPGARYYWVFEVGTPVLLAVNLAAAAWRCRDLAPERRRSMSVLFPAYLLWAGSLLSVYYLSLEGWTRILVLTVGGLALPVAVGYVFARDRLWSVERPARRLITSFLLLTALIILYGGAFALLWATADNIVTVILLSLLIGGTLRPVTQAAARLTDRLYYGERARPYHVVRDLAQRMSDAVQPQEVPSLMCAVLVEALRIPAARVRVSTRGGPRDLAAEGSGPTPHDLPITHHSEVIGHLLVASRPGEDQLDQQDRDVLRLLTDQFAPSLALLHLSEDLQAGREQLVTAREEERRRIRRDLHDGLGPTLSGLRLRVDTAQALLPDGSPAIEPLNQISECIATMVHDIRRITAGLVPAPLPELGLAASLDRLLDNAGAGLHTSMTLSPVPLPALPAALEVAIYHITAEALTNVIKHSRARHVTVNLWVGQSTVVLTVEDDGTGLPDKAAEHAGIGRSSMRERAAELGGHVEFENGTSGLVVRAIMPRTRQPPVVGRG
ncbi:histidine kinase [Nonomuraea sp. NPDC050556]|uniref:sensor histidine kinase n=1 Tax=Nonomuraea sp. NPDC050556 TaxID=3364369 RepID=UPI0037B69D94